MTDRFNTIAGWTLFAGIVALGAGIVSSKMFHEERPEPMAMRSKASKSRAKAAPRPARRSTRCWPAPTRPRARRSSPSAWPATRSTRAAPTASAPNLYATVGEAIAEGKAGFAFSDALKKVGGTWTFDQLNKWLTSPRDFAPGTKMSFAGLGNPEDRANLIVYLNAQGSNLPLPKADAAPAPAEGANAAAPAAGNAAAPAGNAAE